MLGDWWVYQDIYEAYELEWFWDDDLLVDERRGETIVVVSEYGWF